MISPTRQSGFTILEIMIATGILVTGLLGVFALFPAAITTGTSAIKTTYGVLIAQSVEQAIRTSLAKRKGHSKDGYTFFIFQHEGVADELPETLDRARPSGDYYILLPEPNLQPGSSGSDKKRGSAYESGRTFVYPEANGTQWQHFNSTKAQFDSIAGDKLPSGYSANGRGNPRKSMNDILTVSDDNGVESQVPNVGRVYMLGEKFIRNLVGELGDGSKETKAAYGDLDRFKKWSFAFSIRPAFLDASRSLTAIQPLENQQVRPAGELYEVMIMVYSSFINPFDDDGNRIFQNEPFYKQKIFIHK